MPGTLSNSGPALKIEHADLFDAAPAALGVPRATRSTPVLDEVEMQ